MNAAFSGFRHGHIFSLYNYMRKNDEINIAGCFEENEEAKKEAMEGRNLVFNYNSYEEILNDENVDIVAIGDYYEKRGKMVIEALRHGKHVFCDKPLCTKLEELYEIRELSQKYNLQVGCMLDLRYMAQISKVKEIISNGEIGTIHIASFTGQHCLGYESRPHWYYEDNKHGGTINDIGIHGIDLIRFITGKNLTKVDCAKEWNAFADKEPQFKDSAQFMADMEGMAVMGDVSYAAPAFKGILPTYWDFKLWGSKGLLSFNLADRNIHIYKQTEEIVECEKLPTAYVDEFVKEIKGIKTDFNTGDILDSQEQVLKIQKAVL